MDPKPVRIYSVRDVPRLRFIAGLILGDILGLSWEVITDKRKLRKHPVINYSDENIDGSFSIHPHPILFEKKVTEQDVSVTKWNNLPVFFRSPDESDFPFDIFAASFFLVSRYEEYLDYQPDEHGRFPAAASLAFQNGFLSTPVVDLWARELSKALVKKFRTITFRRNQYRSIVTIDTDEPFAYLGKNFFRSIGGLVNDIAAGMQKAAVRYRTVSQGDKDPFDVFDYITTTIDKYKLDARFFFPTGDKSKHDLNPSWKNEEYRKMITAIGTRYHTGLHPSYASSGSSAMVREESVRMKAILEREIYCSRFHYIRLLMPQSYRHIIEAGMLEDYSMGYPDEPGFRAGIARPYYFFDLIEDNVTCLKIFPFEVMDGTLYQYKNLDHVKSIDIIRTLINETKKVGGVFISIWHNTSLLDNDKCKGRRKVFEEMIQLQSNDSLS